MALLPLGLERKVAIGGHLPVVMEGSLAYGRIEEVALAKCFSNRSFFPPIESPCHLHRMSRQA